ncbi:MAG: hypothetical protein AAFV29_07565, partial [Myxococcota bacterium]
EDAEAANAAAQAAKERGLVSDDGAGRYFQDLPEDRLGDPSLTHPDDMQRILGPSVRFAQHAMVLAQAQLDAGVDRADALAFLANIYVQAKDRAYANKALREFGPATGILDIYPLELVDHLLEFVPGFCHRIRRTGFLTSSQTAGYRAKVGQTIELTYDPKLRIRGFAIKDGLRPGYLLEPVDPPGTYRLVFLSPGDFTAMVSAISKDGELWIETFPCQITKGQSDAAQLLGLQREHGFQRPADPSDSAPAKEKTAPDDLKIHFPRRI